MLAAIKETWDITIVRAISGVREALVRNHLARNAFPSMPLLPAKRLMCVRRECNATGMRTFRVIAMAGMTTVGLLGLAKLHAATPQVTALPAATPQVIALPAAALLTITTLVDASVVFMTHQAAGAHRRTGIRRKRRARKKDAS